MSQFSPVYTRNVKAAANLSANRFVTFAGTVPTAGGNVLGVNNQAATSGEFTSVTVLGSAIVEAGAEITANALVETTNTGKAIPKDTGVAVGRAMQAAVGDGHKIEVLLIQN